MSHMRFVLVDSVWWYVVLAATWRCHVLGQAEAHTLPPRLRHRSAVNNDMTMSLMNWTENYVSIHCFRALTDNERMRVHVVLPRTDTLWTFTANSARYWSVDRSLRQRCSLAVVPLQSLLAPCSPLRYCLVLASMKTLRQVGCMYVTQQNSVSWGKTSLHWPPLKFENLVNKDCHICHSVLSAKRNFRGRDLIVREIVTEIFDCINLIECLRVKFGCYPLNIWINITPLSTNKKSCAEQQLLKSSLELSVSTELTF